MAATKKAPAKRRRPAAQRKARRGKPEGAPRFRPTQEQRAQVEKMVGMGLTYKQIAALTLNPATKKGISTTTLQQRFEGELETGQAKALVTVAASLYQKAISASHPQAAACAMFFLKCRGGWRQEDKIVHEIEGTGVLVAPAGRTPDDWIAEQDRLNATRESPERNGHD